MNLFSDEIQNLIKAITAGLALIIAGNTFYEKIVTPIIPAKQAAFIRMMAVEDTQPGAKARVIIEIDKFRACKPVTVAVAVVDSNNASWAVDTSIDNLILPKGLGQRAFYNVTVPEGVAIGPAVGTFEIWYGQCRDGADPTTPVTGHIEPFVILAKLR